MPKKSKTKQHPRKKGAAPRKKRRRSRVKRALRKTGRAVKKGLKKIARVTWKGARIALPIAAVALPGGSLASAAVKAIVKAEKEFTGPGRGAEKKQRATEIVIGALAAYELATGRELVDQQKLGRALGPIIGLLIDHLVSDMNRERAKKK